ncbi:hypothetical protein FTX61_05615 [Nitriliruptoraceae bacterium ZYF776]|nr:hypothetical protein [Profundirhabdus halotolerans]
MTRPSARRWTRPSGGGSRRPIAARRRASGARDGPDHDGAVSFEAAMLLPIMAVLFTLLLVFASVGRDLIVLHEGARAGARAAATTTDDAEVVRLAREAAPELRDLDVTVVPSVRQDGDVVRVIVTTRRSYLFGIRPSLRAQAVSRVEPGVAAGPS